MIKNSTKNTKDSLKNQMQESVSVVGAQNRDIELGICLQKLKRKSFGLGNSVFEDLDLMLVGN